MPNKVEIVVEVDSKTGEARIKGLGDSMERTGRKGKRGFDTAGQGLDRLKAKLSPTIGLVTKLAAAFGAYKFAQWTKGAALMAARYETLGVVMEVIGKNAGYSKEQLHALEKQLQKNGIAMIESRQTIARMVQANIDLVHASDLARIAQDAAVIGNINSSEAFERMIYGIQSAQVEMLRTIGLNVNFEQSYARMAKQLGKNTKELTQQEKALARVQVVLEAGTRIVGTYEASMTTAGKQLKSFKRYLDDFQVKMGEAFGPATSKIVTDLTVSLKGFSEEIQKPEAQEGLMALGDSVAYMTEKLIALANVLIYLQGERAAFAQIASVGGFLDIDENGNLFAANKKQEVLGPKGLNQLRSGRTEPHRLYSGRDTIPQKETPDLEPGGGFDKFFLSKQGYKSGQADQAAKDSIKEADEQWKEHNKLLAEAEDLYRDVRTPAEEYAATRERLNYLEGEGLISKETLNRGLAAAADEYAKTMKQMEESTWSLNEFQIQAYRNMQDVGSEFWRSMREGNDNYLESFKDMTLRMVDEWLSAQMMMAAFGKNFGSGGEVGGWVGQAATWAAAFFGGGRATGGPTSPATMYEVVENGPELLNVGNKTYLMMGDQPGHVTPARSSGRTGGNITVHNETHVTVQSGSGDQSSDMALAQKIGMVVNQGLEQKMKKIMADEQRPGGMLNPQGVN